LSTGVLVLPVIAPSTYQGWLSRPVEVSEAADGLVQVSYFDSGSGVEEYRYAVDTASGLVRNLEKYREYASGYRYRSFNSAFFYDETGDVPVLRMIATNGDTTLSRGGYRFFDIEVDTPLDDTLFAPGSGVRYVSKRMGRDAMPVFGAQSASFDLRGRALPSAGREHVARGLRVIVTSGENRRVTVVGDQRDCR
jgi:hypothetical protein